MGKTAALSDQHDQPLISFCLSCGGRSLVFPFLFLDSFESVCLLVSTGMLPWAETTSVCFPNPTCTANASVMSMSMFARGSFVSFSQRYLLWDAIQHPSAQVNQEECRQFGNCGHDRDKSDVEEINLLLCPTPLGPPDSFLYKVTWEPDLELRTGAFNTTN